MASKTIGKTRLTTLSLGSLHTHELHENHIVVRWLGLIPIRRIHLSTIHYLRLASRNEVTPLYFFFNWAQFMARHRATRPVYVLKPRSRKKIFLKLNGSAHFKLRQAIGRHNNQSLHRAF